MKVPYLAKDMTLTDDPPQAVNEPRGPALRVRKGGIDGFDSALAAEAGSPFTLEKAEAFHGHFYPG